ncbi:MAG: copper resistance CopC family protein [Candidatus Rokuibacteriota bacterium]
MRISDRLHHDPDAARQARGLRGPLGPRARRLALTRAGRGLAAASLALLLTTGADAHSLLLESSPAAGATLGGGPTKISLRFNNRIEKKLSTLRVLDADGAQPPVTLLLGDGAADRLTGTVPALAPGAWRVEWQVLSTDGHIVSGSFSFRVAPAAMR